MFMFEKYLRVIFQRVKKRFPTLQSCQRPKRYSKTIKAAFIGHMSWVNIHNVISSISWSDPLNAAQQFCIFSRQLNDRRCVLWHSTNSFVRPMRCRYPPVFLLRAHLLFPVMQLDGFTFCWRQDDLPLRGTASRYSRHLLVSGLLKLGKQHQGQSVSPVGCQEQ